MPRPRFTRLPAERRREILVQAAGVFAARGYAGASMAELLAASGLSKGAAYYWFDDKADLFATVVEHAVHRLEPALPDPAGLTADGYWPALRALYVHQLQALGRDPTLWRVVRAAPLACGHPDDGPRIAERLAPLDAWLQALFARGRALGQLRDDLPDTLLLAMVGGLDGAIDAWVLAHPGQLQGPASAALAERCFDSLRVLARGPGALTRAPDDAPDDAPDASDLRWDP